MVPLIPFNRPHATGNEAARITQAIRNGHLSGGGEFSSRCAARLERDVRARRALMTHSATGALEVAVMLAGIGLGDEVIMPSFAFVSTANAVALRGGIPVFVDVRADTLNLDERLVADAITDRTRAVFAVHYAGVGCEMGALVATAARYGLALLEDAAQGIEATYQGFPLGAIGDAGAISFHETKNVTCGEGGALLVNREDWVDRAHVIYDKGTDRRRFLDGHVDKYTWRDLGSSYAMSDLSAAFLWAQLENVEAITKARLRIWDGYHAAFETLEQQGLARRPVVPADRTHNAHLYYLLLPSREIRDGLIASLAAAGIQAVSHYQPLHLSRAGLRYGRTVDALLPETVRAAECLVRLPLWPDLRMTAVARIVDATIGALQ